MKDTKTLAGTFTVEGMTFEFSGSHTIETSDESAVKLSELSTRRTMAVCRSTVAVAVNLKDASANVGDIIEKAEPFVSKLVEHVGSLVDILKGADGEAGFEEA